MTKPEDEREKLSIASLSRLTALGVEYIQKVNQPFNGIPTPSRHFNASQVNLGAFGCFQAHRQALENEFTEDFLAVAECDCVLRTSPEMFLKKLKEICKAMDRRPEIVCTSVGGSCHSSYLTRTIEGLHICRKVMFTQFMLYPIRHKPLLLEKFSQEDWHCYDVWISNLFGTKNALAITPVRWTTQAAGISLIDHRMRRGRGYKRLGIYTSQDVMAGVNE